jgi:hypothetical protein
MRWHEIVGESDLTNKARSDILDILAPLKSQGVGKITVQQILDNLKANPDFSGISLDADFVMDAVKSLKAVSKIQPDPDSQGAMTAYLDTPVGTRQVDPKTADKEKADISKAAMRTLNKKVK